MIHKSVIEEKEEEEEDDDDEKKRRRARGTSRGGLEDVLVCPGVPTPSRERVLY